MRRSLGARELVGPIIAMTITLAAVYAPIGLQGGLTGSLFREFAFTLAGAVTISGVVALTLSPMMSATLLKPGIAEHGLAGRIARDFKRIRAVYGRCARRHPRRAPGRLHGLGRRQPARRPHVHHVPRGACARRRPGGYFRHLRRGGQFHPRPDQPVCRGGQPGVSQRAGNGLHLPDHVSGQRLRRHGRQAVGRAQAHHLSDPAGSASENCVPSRASGCFR